jgi:hypothetical protein
MKIQCRIDELCCSANTHGKYPKTIADKVVQEKIRQVSTLRVVAVFFGDTMRPSTPPAILGCTQRRVPRNLFVNKALLDLSWFVPFVCSSGIVWPGNLLWGVAMLTGESKNFWIIEIHDFHKSSGRKNPLQNYFILITSFSQFVILTVLQFSVRVSFECY